MASITNVVLSRASLKFLDDYCKELGLGNDTVIFQTEADHKAKKILLWGKANILLRLHCGGFSVRCNFISSYLTL